MSNRSAGLSKSESAHENVTSAQHARDKAAAEKRRGRIWDAPLGAKHFPLPPDLAGGPWWGEKQGISFRSIGGGHSVRISPAEAEKLREKYRETLTHYRAPIVRTTKRGVKRDAFVRKKLKDGNPVAICHCSLPPWALPTIQRETTRGEQEELIQRLFNRVTRTMEEHGYYPVCGDCHGNTDQLHFAVEHLRINPQTLKLINAQTQSPWDVPAERLHRHHLLGEKETADIVYKLEQMYPRIYGVVPIDILAHRAMDEELYAWAKEKHLIHKIEHAASGYRRFRDRKMEYLELQAEKMRNDRWRGVKGFTYDLMSAAAMARLMQLEREFVRKRKQQKEQDQQFILDIVEEANRLY